MNETEILFFDGKSRRFCSLDLITNSIKTLVKNVGATYPWFSQWAKGESLILLQVGDSKIGFLNHNSRVIQSFELESEVQHISHYKNDMYYVVTATSLYFVNVIVFFKRKKDKIPFILSLGPQKIRNVQIALSRYLLLFYGHKKELWVRSYDLNAGLFTPSCISSLCLGSK